MRMPAIGVALACAALALPFAAQAHHGAPAPQSYDDFEPTSDDAETVRELNMMLMATSLRCRTSQFDFRREYEDFSRYNLHHLNRAHDRLRHAMRARYGDNRAQVELERFDADMANRYGGGHPRMNCAQLRDAAMWLAEPLDEVTLVDVAWDLLYPPTDDYYDR